MTAWLSRVDATTVFWTLVTVLDVAAVSRALWRTQGVERTLMWIFAILAFPGVGALSYFLLANPSVYRTTSRKRAASSRVRDSMKRRGEGRSASPDTSLSSLAAALTAYTPTMGNAIELLSDSQAAFALIEETLRNAQHFVWAEYYIIRNDATGQRFLELLAERARAGVEVRLLVDAVGTPALERRVEEAIKNAGGKIQTFHPLNPLRRRWSFHLRNHRKLMIVDGVLGFTGSMNVGNEYAGRLLRERRGGLYHDMHLRIQGPAVADLCEIFAEDWFFAASEVLRFPLSSEEPLAGGATVSVLPSGPDQEHNATALLYFGGMSEARERLYLATPYFVPDEPTVRALQTAALRGVDVRLMVPEHSDGRMVAAAGRSYFTALLRSGVRIFEYRPEMLHSKIMVVDRRASFVGSANLDIRSFRLNFELGALVMDEVFTAQLAERFLKDLELSVEVTAARMARRGLWTQAGERLARLLSPVL